MIRLLHVIAAMAAMLLAAMPAMAQEDSRVTVGVTAGSLGVGPEVGLRVNDMIGLRGSASFLNVKHDFSIDDIRYRGRVKLESYGAVVDFYPFDSGFRLSGGFRVDKNRADVSASPTTAVTVGNSSFTPAQIGTLTGREKANEFAPLVTVGYAASKTHGLKFGVDAGVMLQGKPRVGPLDATGTLAADPAFQSELARERIKINDKVDGYQVYPIVQFTLFYAF